MVLRKLQMDDAEAMFRWMHDENVIHYLDGKFSGKTIEDCRNFIRESGWDMQNLHMAITDENDAYVGTVSLKHIDNERHCAEFAIVVSSSAMGSGLSAQAMHEIIEMGFQELRLEVIQWCVKPENIRAIRFYDKRYKQIEKPLPEIGRCYQGESLLWYEVKRSRYGETD